METITIRGIEIKTFIVKDSFNRKAQQFKNQIINALSKLGIPEDQTDIPLERFALKNAPAHAEWFMDGHRLYYSHSKSNKYAENLYIVAQVIIHQVQTVLNGEKTIHDFITEFTEDENISEQRQQARETLGLDSDTKDMTLIDKRYKELAKQHHPDTPNGNIETFKKVNRAHKILKRELE